MLKTLHINTEPTWRGGEQQTLLLVKGLRSSGHTADLAAPPGAPLTQRASEEGLRVFPVRMRGEADLLAVFRLRKLLKQHSYDIVHAHTSHAHTLAALAAVNLPVKVIVARRVDFSIYRHSFLGLNGIKYTFRVNRIITVSEAIRKVLITDGLPEKKISVVHSGVDPHRFPETDYRAPLSPDCAVPENARVVLNIAHFSPHKGQGYLIDAFQHILKRVPDAFLLIAGDGELYSEMQAKIVRLGIAHRTSLPGFRNDIGVLLHNADLFVMPSTAEGLGTSVLDAFLFSLPVVASRTGGIPEMIEHGKNGLVCEPASTDQLADAISNILTDPALAQRLGENARETVLTKFSHTTMVNKTITIYKNEVKKGEL